MAALVVRGRCGMMCDGGVMLLVLLSILIFINRAANEACWAGHCRYKQSSSSHAHAVTQLHCAPASSVLTCCDNTLMYQVDK